MRQRLSGLFAALSALCAPALAQVTPLEIRSLTPPNGSGYSAVFRLTVADGGDGASVSSVGISIAERFDPARPINTCLVYWDRNADAFFLADPGGATWRRTAARAGAPLENAHCRIVPPESRIATNGSPRSI